MLRCNGINCKVKDNCLRYSTDEIYAYIRQINSEVRKDGDCKFQITPKYNETKEKLSYNSPQKKTK